MCCLWTPSVGMWREDIIYVASSVEHACVKPIPGVKYKHSGFFFASSFLALISQDEFSKPHDCLTELYNEE